MPPPSHAGAPALCTLTTTLTPSPTPNPNNPSPSPNPSPNPTTQVRLLSDRGVAFGAFKALQAQMTREMDTATGGVHASVEKVAAAASRLLQGQGARSSSPSSNPDPDPRLNPKPDPNFNPNPNQARAARGALPAATGYPLSTSRCRWSKMAGRWTSPSCRRCCALCVTSSTWVRVTVGVRARIRPRPRVVVPNPPYPYP